MLVSPLRVAVVGLTPIEKSPAPRLTAAMTVPVSAARGGDVALDTDAVTHPVRESYGCELNGCHVVPLTQLSEFPPVPRLHTVMESDDHALPRPTATS